MTSIRDSQLRGVMIVLLMSGLAPFARAQVFDYDVPGANFQYQFGFDINRIGDLDGDGCEDFIVGAPAYPGGTLYIGEAIVCSGINGAVLATIGGDSGSHLGNSVDGGIDADSDGYPDVIIGSYEETITGGQTRGGRVFVFSPHLNVDLYDIFGSVYDGYLGDAVRSLRADIDGDGVNDFIAGEFGVDQVHVYSGATGALLYTETGASGSGFGYSVGHAGDMNSDGVADFLVGTPYYVDSAGKQTGQVTAWSGKDGTKLWGTHGADGSWFGTSLTSAGDFDGDGVSDCIVGAPYHLDPMGNPTGAVSVLSGVDGSLVYHVYGDQSGDFLGWSVNNVGGDVDRDGTHDFIAGAPEANSGTGYARLYSGATGGVLYTYSPQTYDPTNVEQYGWSVAGGDINGDGEPDTLIGGYGFDNYAGIVEAWAAPVAAWWTYGFGWGGTFGIPAIAAQNNPVVGQTLGVSVSNSLGAQTVALLILGTSEATIPTGKGGTILVSPLQFIPLAVPAGGLTLSGQIPDDPALYGFNLDLQALEVDAGASKGVSFTPGLDLYFGFP